MFKPSVLLPCSFLHLELSLASKVFIGVLIRVAQTVYGTSGMTDK